MSLRRQWLFILHIIRKWYRLIRACWLFVWFSCKNIVAGDDDILRSTSRYCFLSFLFLAIYEGQLNIFLGFLCINMSE